MVALLQHGFRFSFSSVFNIIIDYYEELTHVLFGWAEPYLRSTLSYLGSLTGLHLHLYPHWKHVFILLELYFGSHVRSVRAERGIYATLFNLVLGLSLALVAGIGSGTVASEDTTSSMLIAAFPVAAVVLYSFGTSARAAIYFRKPGESWWHAFRIFGRHTIRIGAVGTAAVVGGMVLGKLPFVHLLQGSGLVLLFLLILALAFYRISVGAWYANHDRAEGQGWWERFHVTGYGTVGILMLFTLLGAILFILANAGLSLIGL